MIPAEKEHFKITAAAGYLGLSPNTVRRYTDVGLIRAKRLPGGDRLYKREWLDEFVANLPDAADPFDRGPAETIIGLQSDLSSNPRKGGQ